ncbi:MAG: succinate dehydrogenase cytochrome b subunit [Nitrospiraceae bacterium]|nr:succinate dehydrogenase cytochrome b subunit [Nitrospiraceae bacterium]
MDILKNSVGRKLVMAVTGFGMIAFVIAHLLGNTTLYSGPDGINAYAGALHSCGVFLWTFRLTMAVMLSLHVFFGIQLTLENRAARPQAYTVTNYRASTFAGRNMIWTGLLIGVFLLYHLLQFTLQVTDPEIAAVRHPDALGRPDVFTMVALSFRKAAVAAVYVCAMAALGLHLGHSIQSSLQTLGLNSERTFPAITKGGIIAAILIALGFVSFPLVIYAGLLR